MPQLGRVEQHNEDRVQPKQPTPVRIVSATKATTVLTLVFNQPVTKIRDVVPQYTTDVAGATPLSATALTIDTVAVTFSADITAATEVNIPYLDPAVRSKDGGYIADSTFPVA